MEENMIAYIGANTGLIWNVLDKLDKIDVKQFEKATRIHTEKGVYAALGWLAKKEELTFVYEGGMLFVSLR